MPIGNMAVSMLNLITNYDMSNSSIVKALKNPTHFHKHNTGIILGSLSTLKPLAGKKLTSLINKGKTYRVDNTIKPLKLDLSETNKSASFNSSFQPALSSTNVDMYV